MINLILFCFATASLTLFLDMCMQEGMILHRYYKAIEGLPVVVFKPLGGCTYCMGFWIYIISIILIHVTELQIIQASRFEDFALLAFLGIGFNYVFIKVIEKL